MKTLVRKCPKCDVKGVCEFALLWWYGKPERFVCGACHRSFESRTKGGWICIVSFWLLVGLVMLGLALPEPTD